MGCHCKFRVPATFKSGRSDAFKVAATLSITVLAVGVTFIGLWAENASAVGYAIFTLRHVELSNEINIFSREETVSGMGCAALVHFGGVRSAPVYGEWVDVGIVRKISVLCFFVFFLRFCFLLLLCKVTNKWGSEK